MLAALTPEQFVGVPACAELKALTVSTIASPEPCTARSPRCGPSAWAFDNGEFDPELRCVARPVRDFSGQVIGTIGISGLVWRLSINMLQ